MTLRRSSGAQVWKEQGRRALPPWTTWMLLATTDTFTAPEKPGREAGESDLPWLNLLVASQSALGFGPGTWVPGMALSGVQTLLQTRVRTQVGLIARLKGTPVLCNMEKAKTISYEDLRELLDQKKVQIFDVRSAEEVAKGRIAHSVHIPVGEVEEAFKMDPEAFKAKYGVEKPQAEEENLVFHCQMGKRGAQATEIATALGYAKARNFAGGYQEWSEKGGK